MPVYTVHGPISDNARPAPERIVLVRDGFSFWALLFGPLWLVWHRLWWALLGYLAVIFAVGTLAGMLGLSANVKMLINLLIAVLLGLEATSLRRWTLSRGRWRHLDLVVADHQDAAERRFFDRFTGARHDFDAPGRGAPPPSRPPAMRGVAPDDIIGLFPQPGTPR